MPTRSVSRVHFEDYGGENFERLVFAYHVRAGWVDVAWFGQTGSDLGRDVIGTEVDDSGIRRRTIVQCVNRAALTLAKAVADMKKAAAAPTGKPDAFKFVCRSPVSAKTRDKISKAANGLGIGHTTIWSGPEFEEHLRHHGEYLLRRFVDGIVFPDDEEQLRRFADDFPELSDNDMLSLMAAALDRPAFRTPFHQESSLPAFQRALDDTIEALNTGRWRARDGGEIRRIPSVHNLKDPTIKAAIRQIIQQVDDLRRTFVQGLRNGNIRPCDCGQSTCSTFFFREGVESVWITHEYASWLASARCIRPSTCISVEAGSD
jgi:hypothetical protein